MTISKCEKSSKSHLHNPVYLAEEIRRSEGIQLLETRELLPNTRPRFEVPVDFSGFETFPVEDLGKAEELGGILFTPCFSVRILASRFRALDGLGCARALGSSRLANIFVTLT